MLNRRLMVHAAIALTVSAPIASVAAQEMIRQYRFMPGGDANVLTLVEVPMPEAGPGEVLVRVHANSLNRRDLLMMNNQYGPAGNAGGGIPLSDGAGEVIAVGAGVTRFGVGDRVEVGS